MDPETGRISLFWEIIAGGTAGGCQVVSAKRSLFLLLETAQDAVQVFTNPLEIVYVLLRCIFEHRAYMKDR